MQMTRSLVRRGLLTALGVATVLGSAPTASAANLLVNGSFEAGTGNPGTQWSTLAAGSPVLTGWTVGAGSIDWIGTYWQAADGVRSVDLHGNVAGTLSQTFATQVGQQYLVRFALAGNPDGAPSTKTAQVTSGNAVENVSFTLPAGTTRANMNWTYEEFTFTALAASSTLSFVSTSSGVFFGAAIDDVSVTLVPEPAAATLLGLAFLVARRRHRRP